MKRKYSIVYLLLCSTHFLHAQSFVIKKNKKPSLHTLKESCCNQLADLIKDIPPVLRSIAQEKQTPTNLVHCLANLQEFACAELEHYVEGSSPALVKRATKKELEQLHSQLGASHEILANLSNPHYTQKKEAISQLEKNTRWFASQQKSR